MSKQEEPHDGDAETWLLGGVFSDPRSIAAIAGMLQPADFYYEKNRLVWHAMQELHKEGKPIDIVTVSGMLKKSGEFDSLFRENDYLFNLHESVVSAANIEHYVELVKEASQKRGLISAGRAAAASAYDPSMSAAECLRNALDAISAIATSGTGAHIEHIGDAAARLLESIALRKKEGKGGGIGSDFMQMDSLTGGFRNRELTIIGARPGVGKTSFALGLAIHAAKTAGPVLMFSLEMDESQISARAMSCHSLVSVKKTMDAALDMAEMHNQGEAVRILRNVPLYIDFTRGYSVSKIAGISHAFAAKMPLAMIVVDYLQIIDTCPDRRSYENRNVAIGAMTRALKILSGRLGCPVVALSQLNRDIDKATGKPGARKPRLSDLRESGSIEQDADVVILLHRLTSAKDGDISATDLMVAKNRSGPTGEIRIHFNPQNAMFSEYESYTY